MRRITRLDYDQMLQEMKAAHLEQVRLHGRMTNMKKTLAHSPVAFRSLMTWYDLRDNVVPFLGDRLTNLFAHSISNQTDCLICSTFFRRILKDAGENPDHLELNETEQLVVEFGRQLVTDANSVSDELFAKLRGRFSESEVVDLTAFGALMIATNIFNNALKIELDDYLVPYKKGTK
jgi:alkylhydroperoxidase family enzyme